MVEYLLTASSSHDMGGVGTAPGAHLVRGLSPSCQQVLCSSNCQSWALTTSLRLGGDDIDVQGVLSRSGHVVSVSPKPASCSMLRICT